MGGVFQVILIYLTSSCIVETCMIYEKGPQPFPTPPNGSCICGRKNPQLSSRIVGGSETEVNEYPWMAYLFFKEEKKKHRYCGGSILNERFILTAAQLFQGKKQRDVSIYLGDHDRSTNYETHLQVHYPQEIFIHENFRTNPTVNDIALIKTVHKIKFNNIVSPICLPEPGQDFTGESAIAIGWGITGFTESSPNVLREVKVKVLSDKGCKAESNNGIRHFPEILCAMGNKKGICSGDCGGSLMVENKLGHYEQIGVPSFTYYCSKLGYPDGYARVTEYLDWIRKHVDYCSKGKVVYRI